MVTSWGGSMPHHVSLKLLLSLTVPRNKMSKLKFTSTENVIFWQSLDGTRKLKSTQGEDTEDEDRDAHLW